jgi:hypothetical protein
MNLDYKTLYGDILIFKNKNDCMTISRGNNGKVDIDSIEIDGEKLEDEEYNYNLLSHPKNTFTQDEANYFIENYDKIIF